MQLQKLLVRLFPCLETVVSSKKINSLEKILFIFNLNNTIIRLKLGFHSMCAQWLISDVPSAMFRIRHLVAHCQQHRDVKTCTEFFSLIACLRIGISSPSSIEMSVRKAAF